MDYNEFKERFTSVMQDPAGKADVATELLADVATVFEGVNALTKKSSADDARIKELESTNQRLFLSITGSGDDSGAGAGDDADDDELTGPDAINNFWTNLEKGDK